MTQQPGKAPPPPPLPGTSWIAQWRSSRLGTRGLGAVLLMGCAAGLLLMGVSVTQWYGLRHIGATAQLGLVAFLLVGGHAAATIWATRRRPPSWRVAITQLPFLAGYATLIAWRLSVRNLDRPTGFPPVYVLWVAVALSAVAWLTIWYAGAPRDSRRATVYLSTVAVLVLANGAGVFAVRWQETSGFGLVGQPSPWSALTSLSNSSCLTIYHTYESGGRTVPVDCPERPGVGQEPGSYDAGHFDDLLCDEQPRAAYQRWWNLSRQYHRIFRLDLLSGPHAITVDGKQLGERLPAAIDGDAATIAVSVKVSFNPYLLPTIVMDKGVEQWTVQLRSVLAGGWKVCHIDVTGPVQVREVPLPTGPSPSPSDDLLGGLRSKLPCAPQDPFPEQHNCPSVTPAPAGSSSGP